MSRLSQSPGPLLHRKRAREESSARSNSVLGSDTAVIDEHKKIKLDETHGTQHEGVHGPPLPADHDQQGGPTPIAIVSAKPTKKASPLVEKMRMLEARYAKVTRALLASESKHTEQQIMRIKKGVCPELNQLVEPLEAVRQQKTTIAEKKLSLQRCQADREWHASRTSAQYDFVKARADLRTSLRQALSRQVFDVSRDFRDLSAESLGVSSDTRLCQRYRSRERILSAPVGASLTEKDEDLILMDIVSTSGPPGIDARVLAAAPILGAFTVPRKDTTAKRNLAAKGQGKPLTTRRKAQNHKLPVVNGAGGQQKFKGSQHHVEMPQPKPMPVGSDSHGSPQHPTIPIKQSKDNADIAFPRNAIQTIPTTGIQHQNPILPSRPDVHVPLVGSTTDQSMPPPRSKSSGSQKAPIRKSSLVLDSEQSSDKYRGCPPAPVHNNVIPGQQYNPWPPQNYSLPVGSPRQDPRSNHHDTQKGMTSDQSATENTTQAALSSKSAFDTPTGSHARYALPNSAQGATQTNPPPLHYDIPFTAPGSTHYRQVQQNMPSSTHLHMPHSVDFNSGSRPSSRQDLGHPGMLHPFKSNDPGIDHLSHNPMSLADHSLSFSGPVSGSSLARNHSLDVAKSQKGILWGGVRR
ncbi:protein of unknown function [Taphrina deformans PYCC 5710]|uniref:Uncharacterized protein n=1 Tax=Taphrina deformans (strain PYCC 5710 / ATCC 11124 / CBS 356.35 / IMI 108563 / JCM 9778 / NBRC 8474) TaxID=1097556 RepID=R4XAQ8_TAPDE|nr:protein of unknown function [Taphrina deformans PYCC 5710]|eukprot:CCG82939.1 protein of unknown function [Taphrina deformans PYCC 5710]